MNIYPFIFLFFILTASKSSFGYCQNLKLDQNIEKGWSFLSEGNLESAKNIFLAESHSPILLIHLYSEIGLAKIAIEEKKYKIAKAHLDQMKEEELQTFSDLWHEWLWTKADLEFRQGNYDVAIEFLEKAIPQKNHSLASFGPKSFHLLSQVWQKKGEEAKEEPIKKQALLKAEEAYQKLKEYYPSFSNEAEAAALYSLKACLFQDPKSYMEAEEHFKQIDSSINQASCLIHEGSNASLEQAYLILEKEDSPAALLLKAEILLKKQEMEEAYNLLSQKKLEAPYHERQLFLLGKLAYEQEQNAASYFEELFETYPTSSLAPEALYWAARCLENDPKKIEYYTRIYQHYKDHSLAPEAYFYCYDLQDYLLGNKAAIKHLHGFKTCFPDSPLVLHALYLEGLDHLHDRRSPEGKWLSRKNLIAAIDAFMEVEMQFDRLKLTDPKSKELKNMAKMERAKTNFLIASGAKGSKQSIYLDYAATVFQEILNEKAFSEPLYYTALILWYKGKLIDAKKSFLEVAENYQDYYQSKSLYQIGMIEKELKNDSEALHFFDLALQNKQHLSIDEILDLMIEKSEAYREKGDLDSAMLQLSSVVDYQAASSLRLKAMYLRAEIYQLQGRPNLARKQLESLSLIGGAKDPWALKAKDLLRHDYGFD